MVVILFILVIGFLGYTLYKKFWIKKTSTPEAKKAASKSLVLDRKKILSLGSKGAEVRELQSILNGILYQAELEGTLDPSLHSPLAEDGDYGSKTQDRVRVFFGQNSINLVSAANMTPTMYLFAEEQKSFFPDYSSDYDSTNYNYLNLE